jgi:ABC-type multidrug transport system fused ATPase/permease subunit
MTAQPDKGDTGPGTSRSTWREAWVLAGYFGSHRWLAALLIGLGLTAALAETVGIGLAVMLLFALLGQGEQLKEGGGLLADLYAIVEAAVGDSVGLVALLFFTIVLVNALLIFANNVVSGIILNRMAERVRNLVHEIYITVGYRYLQKRDHGELLHTLATESWTVSEAFYCLSRIGINLCAIVVLGMGIFALSWVIGVTALIGAGFAMLLTRLLSFRMRKLSRLMLVANQKLAQHMLVSLTGMRTVRIFAREQQVRQAFDAASAEVRNLAIRSETIKSLIGPMGQVANLGVLLVIVLVAVHLETQVSIIIASVLLLMRLQPYLFELETQRLSLANLSAALRDVRQTIERVDKPWPSLGTQQFQGWNQEIRFEAVNFAHQDDGKKSLDNVSFSIPSGQVTMIDGPSGSGKSTILNLILRLYEPDVGRVTVDGVDVNTYTRQSWLDRIGIAGQDVELIDGTVLENVRFGQSDASPEDVREACETVEILDDLDQLPAGLDTPIGAAGLNFSGGQRQRLGLARALLRDPDILLLDEATSALEPDREDRILRRIKDLRQDRTIVFVSHRHSPSFGEVNRVSIRMGKVVSQDNEVAVALG